MPPNWKTLAGITVALILGGCVTDERNATPTVAESPAPIKAEPVAAPVDPAVANAKLPIAPNATFSGLDGKSVSLTKLRGKVVYIDFWAPWCEPCKLGLPFTDRLNSTFKDKGLVVLAVSGDPEKSVKDFMASSDYTFSPMLDPQRFSEKFGVSGIPHTIVIDRNGHIVAEEEGLVPQAETIRNLAKAGLDMSGFEPIRDPMLDRRLAQLLG